MFFGLNPVEEPAWLVDSARFTKIKLTIRQQLDLSKVERSVVSKLKSEGIYTKTIHDMILRGMSLACQNRYYLYLMLRYHETKAFQEFVATIAPLSMITKDCEERFWQLTSLPLEGKLTSSTCLITDWVLTPIDTNVTAESTRCYAPILAQTLLRTFIRKKIPLNQPFSLLESNVDGPRVSLLVSGYMFRSCKCTSVESDKQTVLPDGEVIKEKTCLIHLTDHEDLDTMTIVNKNSIYKEGFTLTLGCQALMTPNLKAMKPLGQSAPSPIDFAFGSVSFWDDLHENDSKQLKRNLRARKKEKMLKMTDEDNDKFWCIVLVQEKDSSWKTLDKGIWDLPRSRFDDDDEKKIKINYQYPSEEQRNTINPVIFKLRNKNSITMRWSRAKPKVKTSKEFSTQSILPKFTWIKKKPTDASVGLKEGLNLVKTLNRDEVTEFEKWLMKKADFDDDLRKYGVDGQIIVGTVRLLMMITGEWWRVKHYLKFPVAPMGKFLNETRADWKRCRVFVPANHYPSFFSVKVKAPLTLESCLGAAFVMEVMLGLGHHLKKQYKKGDPPSYAPNLLRGGVPQNKKLYPNHPRIRLSKSSIVGSAEIRCGYCKDNAAVLLTIEEKKQFFAWVEPNNSEFRFPLTGRKKSSRLMGQWVRQPNDSDYIGDNYPQIPSKKKLNNKFK